MTLPSGTPSQRVKANIAKRQALKKKWDRHCKYTVESEDVPHEFTIEVSKPVDFRIEDRDSENWTRLLDEGVVVDGDGYCYAVIRKGTLKKAFDAIPNNFKGYIDKDHIRAIHLGYYGKDDLRLVKLDGDRYAIDVNVKLDNELYTVKDLIREGRHHALSVEMYTNVDEFATAEKVTGDKKQGKWLVPLIDDLKIEGFAVCENPKNASSVNDGLLENASVEKGYNMTKEELKKLQAEQEAENESTDDSNEEIQNEDVEAPENEDEKADENLETGDTEDKSEDESESEGSEETPDEELSAKLDELDKAIAQLKADNKEKDAKIAELEAQLTKRVEVKMSTEERIAKLLAEATPAKVTEAEGAENMTAKDADRKTGDDIVAAYAAAFAE